MKSLFRRALLASTLLCAACGDEDKPPLFQPKPECMGADVVPLQGDYQLVISQLEIGAEEDGFDLDGDGMPDNKLAGLASLANPAIEDSITAYDILIPLEFFDYPSNAADECVKFGVYLGDYKLDADGDGKDTAEGNGDCNDREAAIRPGVAEIPANLVDDDCDGMADEETVESDAGAPGTVPSSNNVDNDGDGYSPAQGDCDDRTGAGGIHPGATEICGNGLDEDCDGVADHQIDAGDQQLCTPYDAAGTDAIVLDPLSFDMAGNPIIEFNSARTTAMGSAVHLEAGPSVFEVNVPVFEDVNLTLRITGATIEGDLVAMGDGLSVMMGRLGGVLDAHTLDDVKGLDVEEIGLTPENSLLDATVSLLGPIVGLPKKKGTECIMLDIDVDRDGLEAFCDEDDDKAVEKCIDGDGTVIMDMAGMDCTDAKDSSGRYRFVDGISVEMNFRATPAELAEEAAY